MGHCTKYGGCSSRNLLPAVGAVEVTILGVVVSVGVDEVGIDRCPAPIAEDPRCLAPERADRHRLELLHELHEVAVSGCRCRWRRRRGGTRRVSAGQTIARSDDFERVTRING